MITDTLRSFRITIPCNHGEIAFCKNRLSHEGDGSLWCFKWKKKDKATFVRGCEDNYE